MPASPEPPPAWTPGSAEAQALTAAQLAMVIQQQGHVRAGSSASKRTTMLPATLSGPASYGRRSGDYNRRAVSAVPSFRQARTPVRHAHSAGLTEIERDPFPSAPSPALQEAMGAFSPTLSPLAKLQEDSRAVRDLQDENRALRDELTRHKNEAINNLNRRPLAAIAGGGFRGGTAEIRIEKTVSSKPCVCDQLRAKLARVRTELANAQKRDLSSGSRRSSNDTTHCDTEDAEVQTSWLGLLAPEGPEVVDNSTRALLTESSAQTSKASTTEAATQLTPRQCAAAHVAVQAVEVVAPAPARRDIGTQDVRPVSVAAAQTDASAPTMESATQASAAAQATAATQTATDTRQQLKDTVDAFVQMEVASRADAGAQVGGAPLRENSSQTPALPSRVHAETQARTVGVLASTQTVSRGLVSAPTQTVATPQPVVVERWTQIDDTLNAERTDQLKRKLADAEAASAAAGAEVKSLRAELASLRKELRGSEEKAAALQQVVQNRAFRQLNVTILCPRAECNLRGDRIEMDSWNPAKLKAEFEAQVLPRFARVFVEEGLEERKEDSAEDGQPSNGAKCEAAEKAMQEFAEVFRERLSAMLSAPSAAAAYATASQKNRR